MAKKDIKKSLMWLILNEVNSECIIKNLILEFSLTRLNQRAKTNFFFLHDINKIAKLEKVCQTPTTNSFNKKFSIWPVLLFFSFLQRKTNGFEAKDTTEQLARALGEHQANANRDKVSLTAYCCCFLFLYFMFAMLV